MSESAVITFARGQIMEVVAHWPLPGVVNNNWVSSDL